MELGLEKTNWLRIQWIEILLLHFRSLHALKWFHSPQCYWNILKKNSHRGFKVAKFQLHLILLLFCQYLQLGKIISDIEQIEEELYRCCWKKLLLFSWAIFQLKKLYSSKVDKIYLPFRIVLTGCGMTTVCKNSFQGGSLF